MSLMKRRHSQHFELDVEVKKVDILKAVKTNREKHISEFVKAVENYKVKAQALLDERVKLFKDGDFTSDSIPHLGFDISPPENFIETYDSVIGMIEASDADVIKLSRPNYLMFIEDRWDWRDHFEHLNSTYAA